MATILVARHAARVLEILPLDTALSIDVLADAAALVLRRHHRLSQTRESHEAAFESLRSFGKALGTARAAGLETDAARRADLVDEALRLWQATR